MPAASLATLAYPLDSARRFRLKREQRIAHRVPCQIRILGAGHSGPRVIAGETTNRSRGGLAVQIGCDLAAGTRVEVLIPRAGGAPEHADGDVIHTRRVLSGTFEIGIALNIEQHSVTPNS